MRWVSLSGELAFLSIGGSAKGIIAIGGTAYGVIAIGGIAAGGVVAIGMNAAGAVAAFGMNAVAPISFSLINGFGIYCVAGVNGWGGWTEAGVNATGVTPDGAVNTDQSLWPAVALAVALLVASLLLRGERIVRGNPMTLPLSRFLRSTGVEAAEVRARLVAVHDDRIELAQGGELAVFVVDASLATRARSMSGAAVFVSVSRVEEELIDADESGYRDRPDATTRTVLRGRSIERAPSPARYLPKTDDELLWIIGWSARIAALGSIIALLWLTA